MPVNVCVCACVCEPYLGGRKRTRLGDRRQSWELRSGKPEGRMEEPQTPDKDAGRELGGSGASLKQFTERSHLKGV